jgi:Tfp pilus assembly protein PilF
MENLKEKIQLIVDLYKSQKLEKAEILSKKLIEKHTKEVFIYNLLGLILTSQNKDDEAIKYYEEGLKINSKFPEIYNNLGNLIIKNRFDENKKRAEDLFNKSIIINNKIPESFNNLGNLYHNDNKHKKAILNYKKALEINPDFYFAHHNIALIYISAGDLINAKIHLNKAIKLNQNFLVSHRALSRITKFKKDSIEFINLKKTYELIKNDEKYEISFSLAKAYEDINDYSQSFHFYDEANKIFRKKITYSADKEKERFINIKNIFNNDLFSKKKNSGYLNASPIFIVGMPRSGTTLVEQIISNHPKVFAGDELYFIPELFNENFNNFSNILTASTTLFNKIGYDYINKMKSLSKNSFTTTDKLTVNFEWIGFIKLILPNAKIIHCKRNPKDNCLSIFKTHFTSGLVKYAYDFKEIIQYYNYYYDLMNFWNLNIPDFIYNISYENLVSDNESEIKKLIKECNLNWDVECLSFYKNKRYVKTASDIQVRNKIYDTSVDSWINYKDHINDYFSELKT